MSVATPKGEAFQRAAHLAYKIVAINGIEAAAPMLGEYFVAFGRAIKAVSGEDDVRVLLPLILTPSEGRLALASVDGERVVPKPAA